MTEPRPVPSFNHREAFQHHLEQIERRNWENKIFYLPRDIKIWMNAKPRGETYSNVGGLLSNLYSRGFAKISADQCADYLLVLAALLHPDVNCGNLIHFFTQCGLSDNFLSLPDTTSFYNSIAKDLEGEYPRPSLPSNYQQFDYRAVIGAFDKIRWAFCPATLHLHMNTSFPFGPCILPFLHGEVINKKGGTANVHHYKIQEDLVESDELKKALALSKHNDPNSGWCYEFAVKSYVAGWEDMYKFESEAFRGVRNHEGVVKYLGEYHFREGGDTLSNHNIILEYGQQDLDEYIADTCPPVLNAEIIAFWESFFKVASTLKRLHQLEYKGEDGRIQYFKGWHGDIKPDNILRVREEFKLADFGFTKFEKDEIGNSSTFIRGGTRTYGAPECDHQRLGTSTPHLQTIDTWSFGCVLSAVATWVILGPQAYDDYRQVRMLEISQLRQHIKNGKSGTAPSGDDAFHNGTKVLPSVLHWHDFLRNSSRKADTISYRVLDLVEEKMLLERPTERLGFEQLCDKLGDILLLAKNEHSKSLERGYLKKIKPDTLEALLQLDKRAPATATPIVQVNGAQLVTPSPTHGQGSGFPLPNSQSRLRPASDRVRKSERLDRIVIGKTANREEAIKSGLGISIVTEAPELCDSPQQDPVDADERNSRTRVSAKNARHQPVSSAKGKEVDVPEFHLIRNSPVAAHIGEFSPNTMSDGSSPERHIQQSFQSSEHSNNSLEADTFRTDVIPPLRSQPPRNTPQGESKDTSHNRAPPPSPPMSPEIVLWHDDARFPHVHIPHTHTGPLTLASHQIPQPPAVLKEYERLERLWKDKKVPFLTLLSKTPEDPWLKKFIFNRDIVFVVDNAASMVQHWADATKVLVTLAMKIGPLDEDGLDLVYTIGQDLGLQGVKGWDIVKKFENSMECAGREILPRYTTNMRETLQRLFDKYQNMNKKMTLIILTDGLWQGCVSEGDVEKLIVRFITDLGEKLKKWETRWFSIQFVSFGDDEPALKRLQKLDDNMPIEDVIDTKQWWYPEVDKLILGSITDDGDNGAPSPSSLLPSPNLSRPSTPSSNRTLQVLERAPSTRTSSSTKHKRRLSSFFGRK